MLYKVDGNAWRTVGWVDYKPGVCAPVRGAFPRNDFYWYAEDGPGNVTYSGKDAYGCINSSDGFDRTVSGDYQCAANEKIVGFTKIDERQHPRRHHADRLVLTGANVRTPTTKKEPAMTQALSFLRKAGVERRAPACA